MASERGNPPDFTARANTHSRDDESAFWLDIGVAWKYEKDDQQGISVRINATPLNWDGSFILVPRERSV